VGDDQKPFEKDFVANQEIMDTLFKCLLDRHSKFEETEKKDKKSAKKQKKNH